MVYRGKPSKGCAECRAKKTRCDAARPSCGQCRRLGRKCSGYRNLDDLRFLNQTSTVKAKHASSVKSSSSDDWSAPTTPPSPVSSEESTSPSSLAVSRPIIVNPFSWDLGAHTVFFRQYVHAATGPSKTEMNWVIPIFGQAKSSGPLSDIVAALGLVALAGAGSDPSIRRLAAQKYSSSLKKTHLALRDDVEAKSDETMATIILLALHETMVSDDHDGTIENDWIHLHGAIRLCQLRGREQFKTTFGHRLWHRVASHTAYHCLKSKRPIPDALISFQRQVLRFADIHAEERLNVDLMDITARLCVLFAPISTMDRDAAVATYTALVAVEDELKQWHQRLTPIFNLERWQTAADPVFPFQIISYNHIAASVINRYRCVRIQANEQILELIEARGEDLVAGGASIRDQETLSTATIIRLSHDICSNMPFSLGYLPDDDDAEMAGMRDSSMYAGIINLMPLDFASNPKRVPMAMFEWVMDKIERIVKETGIAKAKMILMERRNDALAARG